MLDIIREGGWGMYPVILFGAIALVAAGRRILSWNDDATPVHLALLTFFAGCLGTGVGVANVLRLAADGAITEQQTLTGFRESLNCVLLACGFAILAIILHVTAGLVRRSAAPRP